MRELAGLGPLLRHALRIFGLRGHDDAVEARTRRREGESRGNDTEKCADNVGLERHAEDRRRDVDEPEGKGRHQAQEEEIAQRILLEALAQLGEPGRGARGQPLAERRSRDQEQDGGAERGADDGRQPAEQPAEQQAGSGGQDRARRATRAPRRRCRRRYRPAPTRPCARRARGGSGRAAPRCSRASPRGASPWRAPASMAAPTQQQRSEALAWRSRGMRPSAAGAPRRRPRARRPAGPARPSLAAGSLVQRLLVRPSIGSGAAALRVATDAATDATRRWQPHLPPLSSIRERKRKELMGFAWPVQGFRVAIDLSSASNPISAATSDRLQIGACSSARWALSAGSASFTSSPARACS